VPAPRLTELLPQLEAVDPWLAMARGGGASNDEGGDPVSHADPRLLARHLGNYLAAAEVAVDRDVAPADDLLLDVGCGTGAYSAWLADRLGVPLHLADHDPGVLAAAEARFTVARTHLDAGAAPLAGTVTAMEVLEHVPPAAQAGFVTTLVGRVAPGGVLVLSTPDESLYPGGWSGYAPHVGCVTASGLAVLLAGAAPGLPVEVWRLVGGPFDVPAPRRWLEAVGNRAWTALRGLAPGLAARLADASGGGTAVDTEDGDDGPVLDVGRVPGIDQVRVLPAEHGSGGSLVGVVRRPR